MSDFQPYIPESVIDEMIRATGFIQVSTPDTNIKYKCKWLLERIEILKRDADTVNIVHDKPEISQLVAALKHERSYREGLSHTLDVKREEMERLRDELRAFQRQKPVVIVKLALIALAGWSVAWLCLAFFN
jgi:hypothetical protein